jgi:hypothetical protein
MVDLRGIDHVTKDYTRGEADFLWGNAFDLKGKLKKEPHKYLRG